MTYTREHTDGHARAGTLTTPHGTVQTPAFMPVATRGAIKAGVDPVDLRAIGSQMLLTNTFHLHLRPGELVVEQLGGVQGFTGFHGPMLTDSGGFQVFSLAKMRKIDDDGVTFQSPLDGRKVRFTPEEVMRIEHALGADLIMCFDECPPFPAQRHEVEAAVRRTTAWAKRCRESFDLLRAERDKGQMLLGIVQGGVHLDLRLQSLRELVEIGFDAYAIGGLSVGEPNEEMYRVNDELVHQMPQDKLRYLMGVGTLEDLTRGVMAGVDIFDCVLPSRNARHGVAILSDGTSMRLLRAEYDTDTRPIDQHCHCPACKQYSRGALRHLLKVSEATAGRMITLHNLAVYHAHMRMMREQILAGTFSRWAANWLTNLSAQR